MSLLLYASNKMLALWKAQDKCVERYCEYIHIIWMATNTRIDIRIYYIQSSEIQENINEI